MLIVYIVLLGLIGFAAFLAALPGSWWLTPVAVMGVLFTVAWMSYSWIANLVITLSKRGRA